MFDDGQIALHWEGAHASIAIYKSVEDCMWVHSHNNDTVLVWDDK